MQCTFIVLSICLSLSPLAPGIPPHLPMLHASPDMAALTAMFGGGPPMRPDFPPGFPPIPGGVPPFPPPGNTTQNVAYFIKLT